MQETAISEWNQQRVVGFYDKNAVCTGLQVNHVKKIEIIKNEKIIHKHPYERCRERYYLSLNNEVCFVDRCAIDYYIVHSPLHRAWTQKGECLMSKSKTKKVVHHEKSHKTHDSNYTIVQSLNYPSSQSEYCDYNSESSIFIQGKTFHNRVIRAIPTKILLSAPKKKEEWWSWDRKWYYYNHIQCQNLLALRFIAPKAIALAHGTEIEIFDVTLEQQKPLTLKDTFQNFEPATSLAGAAGFLIAGGQKYMRLYDLESKGLCAKIPISPLSICKAVGVHPLGFWFAALTESSVSPQEHKLTLWALRRHAIKKELMLTLLNRGKPDIRIHFA